jgi:hypothetical protein
MTRRQVANAINPMMIKAILNDSQVISDIDTACGPFDDDIRPASSNTLD